MKKNLISVLILALCVVNLILNIMIVFVCMPSAKKTNNLISEIAGVLTLDLESNKGKTAVALENMATFDIEKQVVNLKDDGSGKGHYVQVGITLELDKSTEDYQQLVTVLGTSSGAIFDEARNVIQSYTYDEINDQKTQDKIKKQLLENLQNKYATRSIYNVSFSTFTAQ